MKILLVTGKLAESLVRKYGKGCDVYVAPVTVAAFLTTEMVARYLSKTSINADLILLPGLCRGSAEIVEKVTGIPTFKGPKNILDLPEVLKAIKEGVKLSRELPADEVLSLDVEEKIKIIRKKAFEIKRERIPLSKIPLIITEVVDAPRTEIQKLVERIEYYVSQGADVIDLGMIAGESHPDFIESIGELKDMLLEKEINVPISVDTLNEKELETAIESKEVDLILSVDEGTLEHMVTSKPTVIVPTNQEEGFFPTNPRDRVLFLEGLLERAKELGYKSVVADPILEAVPNLGRSLVAYKLFRERNEEIPLLMGVGNVVELYDADSVGMNALLGGLAVELEASLLLTTENSCKTRGSVRELKRAVDMNLIRMQKDGPMNLLILKEKRCTKVTYEKAKHIIEARGKEPKLEGMYFRIWIESGRLWVNAYRGVKPILTIVGKEPNEIIDTVLENFKISPRHAFYLGRELERAYNALKLNRTYLQETPLFLEFYGGD